VVCIINMPGYNSRYTQLQIVSDLDFPALQTATERVYSAVPSWSPGLHDTIKKILAG